MAVLNGNPQGNPPPLRLEPFRGMNVSSTPTQIDEHESPDMLNMTIDERGALNKRTGYSRMLPNPLGEGPIKGLFHFRKSDGFEKFLIAQGNKIFITDIPKEKIATWDLEDLSATWESEVQ